MIPEIDMLYRMLLFSQSASPRDIELKASQLANTPVSPDPLLAWLKPQPQPQPQVPQELTLFDMLYAAPNSGPILPPQQTAAPPPSQQDKKPTQPSLTQEQIAALQKMMPQPPAVKMPEYRGGASTSQVNMTGYQIPAQKRVTLFDILQGGRR